MKLAIPLPVFAPEGIAAPPAPTPLAAPVAPVPPTPGGPTPPANPKPSAPTLLDPTPTPAPPDPNTLAAMPQNWRQLMAGTDADALKELERFTDPSKIGSTLLNYKKQMRTGSFDTPPPAEDKPDDLAAWREAHGIPKTAQDYKIPDATSKRLYDEDKPVLEGFLSYAHKANQPQGVIDFATQWYVDMQEKSATAMVEQDKTAARTAEDTLRSTWGNAYTSNFTAAQRAAKEAVPGLDWWSARLPDGRVLGTVPEFVKGMHEYAINRWGAGEFVGQEQTAKSDNRIKEIEGIISTDIEKYTPAMQAEYRELLDAQSKKK